MKEPGQFMKIFLFLVNKVFFVLIFVFKDEMGNYRDRTSDFMRRYLKEFDSTRDIPEPSLSISEVSCSCTDNSRLFHRNNIVFSFVIFFSLVKIVYGIR